MGKLVHCESKKAREKRKKKKKKGQTLLIYARNSRPEAGG